MLAKIVNVLRFRAREPALVARAVKLLMELATGYGSAARFVVRLDTVVRLMRPSSPLLRPSELL